MGRGEQAARLAFLQFLDGELKDRPYIAGASYTVADITALVAVDFMRVSKLAVPDELGQCAALARSGFGPAERRGVVRSDAVRQSRATSR